MSQSTTVTPFEVGAVSAALGAGIGYAAAPRKYSLEQLLTLESDVFIRSIPETKLLNAEENQRLAYAAITDARRSIIEASKSNSGEAKLVELLKSQELNGAYKSIKKFLPKARAQSAIVLAVVGGAIGTIAKMIHSQKTS